MTNHDLQTLLAIDRTTLPPDGGLLYNRLIFSHSPYLLQHARNPVDWREWGPETLQEARQRNLPLFVSIGYATCHWCHVMAHESFEDDEVADILNHGFVPVKVDREERPDLDEFCMAACQTMTGSGGWPLNCFLKPDGTPFYALTYLPKEPRRGMPGFLELLENIAQVWRHKPDSVERNATSLMQALQRLSTPPQPERFMTLPELCKQAADTLRRIYDQQYGGFGTAPKFPMPPYLLQLLRSNDIVLRDMALHTLRSMRQGGIWDQLAGGIHRYSTDRHWLVPHFEKMLYDQALVAYVALEAHQLTNDNQYCDMTENLLEFTLQELTSPQGGFYCGLDADSEAREGACYVWRRQELDALLGADAALFCERYGVTNEGNFEVAGENVLYQAQTIEALSKAHNRPETELAERLDHCVQALLAVRRQREQPLRDLKIITAWNGLLIATLARGAAITGKQHWLAAARKAADFITTSLVAPDGRLLRSYLLGPSPIKGFLDDYAFLAWGLLELYRAGQHKPDLQRAATLCQEALRLFSAADGRLTTAGSDADQLPLALPDLHDGVIPSALSILASNLLTLSTLTDDLNWQHEAQRLLHCYHANLQQNPTASLWLLQAAHAFDSDRQGSEKSFNNSL